MLRTAWRSLLHHSLRLALSALAIVLGVGFVVGTLIFTDTLNNTFSSLFEDTTSDVVVTPAQTIGDSQQVGSVATLPASTLVTVRSVAGVAKATGVVLVDGITIIGSDGTTLGTQGAPHFGSNWEADEALTPFRLTEGSGPTSDADVALDSVSAQKGGYSVGDDVKLVGPDGPFTATLAGIFRYGTSGNLAGATQRAPSSSSSAGRTPSPRSTRSRPTE
jgi:putative ABC transport system permease protein